MMEYKSGDRVKIFFIVGGGFGVGTVVDSEVVGGLAVLPDDYPDDEWYIDAFRLEKIEK